MLKLTSEDQKDSKVHTLRDTHEHAKGLKYVALHLYNLADVFEATGNEKVANQLAEYADRIEVSTKVLENYISYTIYQNVERSNQSSSNMLHAMLAGLEIGEQSKKKK
jgi:hypothetical protein